MRIYQLTDRDFEEFIALMEKIEIQNRLKHGHPIRTHDCKECDLASTYRYHFIGWRNQVMSGDTYARDPDPPHSDQHRRIRLEIERLQKLLPEESKP